MNRAVLIYQQTYFTAGSTMHSTWVPLKMLCCFINYPSPPMRHIDDVWCLRTRRKSTRFLHSNVFHRSCRLMQWEKRHEKPIKNQAVYRWVRGCPILFQILYPPSLHEQGPPPRIVPMKCSLVQRRPVSLQPSLPQGWSQWTATRAAVFGEKIKCTVVCVTLIILTPPPP